ncbi:MAG TPA: DNA-processing protein DprA [Chloroflexota bacterium]|jgi:DNA processing protein
MTDRDYWIALNMAAGIGPVRFQRLLQVCGGAREAWHAADFDLARAGLERRTADSLNALRRTTTPEVICAQLQSQNIQALTLLDAAYPANLRQIADPPPVLFVRGTLCPTDDRAVAVVGTRRATSYGHTVTHRLATDLAAAGVTVVSGLAKGIDTVAHRATIDAGGRTLAVLGNGLDQVYPPENALLAERVSSAGALVSEFPPGTPPDAVNFPRRNRIISGLSRATVIVEAPAHSGALITADFALEQGRDVLVVPGSILTPMSVGPNDLLKQGAIPVTGVADILNTLGEAGRDSVARGVPQLADQESSVWEALGRDPRHVDELARSLGERAGEISAILAMLELKGLARHVGSMLYTRA